MVNMKHLTGLKLAHPEMNDGYFEIMVFIGADYYWSIVQDGAIRENGPLLSSKKSGTYFPDLQLDATRNRRLLQ